MLFLILHTTGKILKVSFYGFMQGFRIITRFYGKIAEIISKIFFNPIDFNAALSFTMKS